ncbi:hypothetical protein B0T17DRAFT_496732 [Bombardia bombarda]|uniref:3beta-hydroxysteroid 3-dehydrogenase n=1 Tax=Bombardia bombarda TaxID=252184 RepID=A0AA39WIN5_9PEZI|nr:hypothetical protein B0T17DRAFT_496732 [Bombardia bombarda]
MATPKGTIIVTGANGGLGSAIVARIASTPEFAAYHGIYTFRDASSPPPALESALQQNGPSKTISHSHEKLPLDLTNLAKVREAAATINARVAAGEIPPIRALVLNAAVQEFVTQDKTDDGFDIAFMVNYLSQWLFTLLLLQSLDKETGRVVVIGSLAHDPSAKQNARMFPDEKWTPILHDSTDPIAKGTWSTTADDPSWNGGFRRYAASKLSAIMMIGELQRRLDTDPILNNISILGIDPGSMPTGLTRNGPWFIRVLVGQIIFPALAGLRTWLAPNGPLRTTYKSAGDVLAAAFESSPVLGERPKGLYLNGSELGDTSLESKSVEKREMLWKDSVRYAQLGEGETVLVNWQ